MERIAAQSQFSFLSKKKTEVRANDIVAINDKAPTGRVITVEIGSILLKPNAAANPAKCIKPWINITKTNKYLIMASRCKIDEPVYCRITNRAERRLIKNDPP